MVDVTLVTHQTHKNMRWKRVDNFSFTKSDSFCPIVAQEIPSAMMFFPICFVPDKDKTNFTLATLLGLQPNENLAVDASGKWLAGYIPAGYRGYPFILAKNSNNENVLCTVENSEFVSKEISDGELFFEDSGKASEAINQLFQFLLQVSANKDLTFAACQMLNKYDLIQPWPIQVQTEDGTKNIEGIYKIDEARLINLSADALLELRNSGALNIIYGQLFSIQHLGRLGDRMQFLQSALKKPSELNFDPILDGGNINFDDL